MPGLPIVIILAAAILTHFTNVILIRYHKQIGNMSSGQEPQQVRWSSGSKPLVGGISFFIVFLLGSLALNMIPHSDTSELYAEILPFMLVCTLGFFIGLWDDAYTTKPLLKFAGQVLCGIVLIYFDLYIHLFGITILDYLITLVWVVGIMNSVNMLDNMDAITGSVSLAILGLAQFIMVYYGFTDSFLYYVNLLIIGSLIGFLILNWHPSKLYMGDTGSMFLGVVLAFMGIRYFWNLPVRGTEELIFSRQLLLPLLAFLVPIMDTSFVFVARIYRGQSPFVGGRDHTTHHLSYLGISQSIVPVIAGSITILSGAIILSVLMIEDKWSHLNTILYSVYVLATFSVFIYLYRLGDKMNKVHMANKAEELKQKEKHEDEPALEKSHSSNGTVHSLTG